MNIVFMGTPDFAVSSLDALIKAGYSITGVITAPDKLAGRGQKTNQSAVKKYAIEKGLKILQPTKLKDPLFLEELKSLKADLQVVVAFRMLPEVVWNMPPKGTINLHGSLLPQYRGAAPINWAIINGEKESGVTTFFLQEKIDTGNIILQENTPISNTCTAGELHESLMKIGARVLIKTVQAIENNNYRQTPQAHLFNENNLKQAPKIFKEDCAINWHQPAENIYNQIRGLSPYPTAFTNFQGKTLKIFRAIIDKNIPEITPGEFISNKKNELKFACLDGFIIVKELQIEGKRKMQIDEFLRGIRL